MVLFDELELIVNDERVEVWYRGRHQATLAVREETGNVVLVVHRDDIELSKKNVFLGLRKLDVFTITKEKPPEGMMALPNRKRRATTEVIKAQRKPRKNNQMSLNDTIAERTRDKILNDILDSYLDNGDQSEAFTREETRRISKKHRESLYAVAGVRAALTRGAYGDFDKELARRRRERAAFARK